VAFLTISSATDDAFLNPSIIQIYHSDQKKKKSNTKLGNFVFDMGDKIEEKLDKLFEVK
jgi:hypothetical protein